MQEKRTKEEIWAEIESLQNLLTKYAESINKKIISAKRELFQLSEKDCSHPVTQEYEWEWDDGYGKQKWMKGLRCLWCGKKNSYPGSSTLWWKEERYEGHEF